MERSKGNEETRRRTRKSKGSRDVKETESGGGEGRGGRDIKGEILRWRERKKYETKKLN